jgi:hypothetical protein
MRQWLPGALLLLLKQEKGVIRAKYQKCLKNEKCFVGFANRKNL